MSLMVLFALASMQSAECQPGVGGGLTLPAHCHSVAPVTPASEGTGPIGTVAWSAYPPIEYPERAMSQDVRSGRVVLLCNQTPEGRLNGCVIEAETPPGMGFGAAALRAMSRARTQGGEPRVRFTLNFTIR